MYRAIFLSLLLTLFVSSTTHAQRFQEGVHYQVLTTPATKQPSITEYFSLYCIACYRFEPIARQLQQSFPQAFSKSHTSALGPKPGMGESMTQAYALALKLDQAQAFNDRVFQQQFAESNPVDSLDSIQSIFAGLGLSDDEFVSHFNSFAVKAKSRQMQRQARRMQITATPTLIINGKYKVLINGFRDSDDLAQDLTTLARQLMQ